MDRKKKVRLITKYSLCFILGAIGYAAIEVMWRGYTHWSMVIAGGLCFIIFSLVAEKFREKNIITKAAICAVGVTAVEFVFGLIFNILLDMNVWDYSGMPLNILGQVCPLFTILWAGIAIAFLPLADEINRNFA